MAVPNRVEDLLVLLEEAILVSPAEGLQRATIRTFAVAGLLRRSQGLVLRMADGAEFHITVTQSRKASDRT